MLETLRLETIPGGLKMITNHGTQVSLGSKHSLQIPKTQPETQECSRVLVENLSWGSRMAKGWCRVRDSGIQVCAPCVTGQQQPRSHEQMCVLWFPFLEGKDNITTPYLKEMEIAASCYY